MIRPYNAFHLNPGRTAPLREPFQNIDGTVGFADLKKGSHSGADREDRAAEPFFHPSLCPLGQLN